MIAADLYHLTIAIKFASASTTLIATTDWQAHYPREQPTALYSPLLSFNPARACQNVASRFGVSEASVETAVYQSGLQTDFEAGKIRQEVFVQQILSSLDLSRTQEPDHVLLDALSDMFEPIESMFMLLETVRNAGVPIGLLSNTCRSHWDWIQRQPYAESLRDFDSMVLSFEIGATKPEPAIYEVAEQAADVPPNQIVFLDDRSENVDAALARGWRAFQCMGGIDAELVLNRLGFGV